MRKFMVLGALVALVVAALALPALAQDRFLNENQEDRFEARQDRFEDRFEDRFFFDDEDGFFFGEDDFFGEDGFFFDDRFNDDDFDNGFDNSGVSQFNEQNVESGDADQSIQVAGGGDNSNACQNVQGINNTGNAVSNNSVLQYGNDDAGVDIEDTGNFTISPQTAVECNQQVNQAASAFGG